MFSARMELTREELSECPNFRAEEIESAYHEPVPQNSLFLHLP